MSYSGFVICNCYKEGKTDTPLFKDYLRIHEGEIYLEEPKGFLKRNKQLYYDMYSQFESWILTACEHKDMRFAYEYLSNSSGMGKFSLILSELGGADNFPILTEYLPKGNDGALPTEFAQEALEELKRLEHDTKGLEYMIEPLMKLATASVKTGNPIVWT